MIDKRLYLVFVFLICLALLYSCSGSSSSDSGGGDSENSTTSSSSNTSAAYNIKGLFPDDILSYDEIADNNANHVGINISWENLQPENKKYFCDYDEVAFDDYCFKVDSGLDESIFEWTKRHVTVTAVLVQVPEWARVDNCDNGDYDENCAPKDPQDFGRFAGMLAQHYNGRNGHGKISNFIILNEVNMSFWFNIGCTTSCDQTEWINKYAEVYNAAYDKIIEQQPESKVLISLTHHFGQQFDMPVSDTPILSGITFLNGFAAKVGTRTWRVAYHPYPPQLAWPEFSADDYYNYGKVTFGSLGVLPGWLRKTFPDKPSSWEIYLTENGISSYSSEEEQVVWLCKSFQNVLGTPGIQSYIYHREVDNETEMEGNAYFGLVDSASNYKQAWTTWASVDNADTLSCGFQDLPYIRLRSGYSFSRGHWVSSRLLPEDFNVEQEWCLLRDEETSTMQMLYECRVDENHNLLSTDVNCEDLDPLGPVGYVYTSQVSGTSPLYRCLSDTSPDHFISSSPDCEGDTLEMLLGYAYPLNNQTQKCNEH